MKSEPVPTAGNTPEKSLSKLVEELSVAASSQPETEDGNTPEPWMLEAAKLIDKGLVGKMFPHVQRIAQIISDCASKSVVPASSKEAKAECPGGDLCDGDLPGEWHEKSCPCYREEVDGVAAKEWEDRRPALHAKFEKFRAAWRKRAEEAEARERRAYDAGARSVVVAPQTKDVDGWTLPTTLLKKVAEDARVQAEGDTNWELIEAVILAYLELAGVAALSSTPKVNEMAKICPLCNEPIWPGPNQLFLDPRIGFAHDVCPRDSMLMKQRNFWRGNHPAQKPLDRFTRETLDVLPFEMNEELETIANHLRLRELPAPPVPDQTKKKEETK